MFMREPRAMSSAVCWHPCNMTTRGIPATDPGGRYKLYVNRPSSSECVGAVLWTMLLHVPVPSTANSGRDLAAALPAAFFAVVARTAGLSACRCRRAIFLATVKNRLPNLLAMHPRYIQYAADPGSGLTAA